MKKVLSALFISFALMSKTFAIFGIADTVFDPTVNASVITEFLSTIDQLYQMYDQTMNQIEMIEQNYEKMQFYIEQAQQFDFENIEWDGDLDFRNEIKAATKQVNRQLNNIRGIRDTFKAKTVTIGNQSFSFASLCGIKDGDNGNAQQMVEAALNYYSDGFAKAASVWAEGVPDKDAQKLWARYGLNPANYKMVRDVEKKLDEKVAYLIGSTEEDLKQQSKEDEEFYKVIENLMDMLGKEDITEKELMQVQGMLYEQTIFTLKNMQSDLKEGMSYLVWQDRYMKQKEEAENQSRIEKMNEENKNSIPDYF